MTTTKALSNLYNQLAKHDGCSRFDVSDNVCLRDANQILSENRDEQKRLKEFDTVNQINELKRLLNECRQLLPLYKCLSTPQSIKKQLLLESIDKALA